VMNIAIDSVRFFLMGSSRTGILFVSSAQPPNSAEKNDHRYQEPPVSRSHSDVAKYHDVAERHE
jgi:hypothetical protein